MEHELFLHDLALRLEVQPRLHEVLGARVDGDHGGGDAIVEFGGVVVDDPEGGVGVGVSWCEGEFRGHEAEAAARVEGILFAGGVAALVLVHF
jgi:hypothetical protein